MVTADDQVRASEVLADDGVQQGFARARVAHLDRVSGLDHRVGAKVVVDHGGDGARPDLGRDIALLKLAEHLMDEDAVRHLYRDLDEVLVAPVHGIARLESGDSRPAALLEHGARLGWTHVKIGIAGGIAALAEHAHWAANNSFARRH